MILHSAGHLSWQTRGGLVKVGQLAVILFTPTETPLESYAGWRRMGERCVYLVCYVPFSVYYKKSSKGFVATKLACACALPFVDVVVVGVMLTSLLDSGIGSETVACMADDLALKLKSHYIKLRYSQCHQS